MNKLLAWAVLTLAIMAGFTARAEAGEKFVIELNDTIQKTYLVICRPAGLVPESKRLGEVDFDSYESCIASPQYKRFVRVWEGAKKETENPHLKHLKPGITEMDIKPMSDDIVLAYVGYFERKTGIKVDRNRIFFGTIDGSAVGICTYYKNLVIIDRTYWNSGLSSYVKEGLVYHELGHCYANRNHVSALTKKFPNQKKLCPTSLMYPKTFSAEQAFRCFSLHRDYYMKEVKTQQTRKVIVTVKVQRFDSKTAKWVLVKKILNAQTGAKVEAGLMKCTFTKYKPTKDKYGYTDTRLNINCSQDHVSYVGINHIVTYHTEPTPWQKGYQAKSTSSDYLRFWNSITKTQYSVHLSAIIK